MGNELARLQQEHAVRQSQRQLTRTPINLVTGLIFIGSIGTAVTLCYRGDVTRGVVVGVVGLIIASLWSISAQLLAELLSDREKISQQIQDTLSEKTEGWGLAVKSIEIRDILIPDNLKDALSKQAQAERERQARGILGDAEREIAEKFVQAAATYRENPVALQLRAMNILYEGLRARGSLMVVPSGVMESLNVGTLAGLASQAPPPDGSDQD